MSKLERFLFQLTVFLIPSNLFLKWILPESYVSGILVDYLLPKVYFSDLPILALLFLWFMKTSRSILSRLEIRSMRNFLLYVLLTTCCTLLIKALLSTAPIAGLWFWLKVIEMSAFFLWIKNHLPLIHNTRYQILKIPLLYALSFQSLLGLYQLLAQKSLAGFWFLGETTLTHTTNIAKISLEGSLLIAPYGTLPHPNVLAGFLSIGTIIHYIISREDKNSQHYHKVLKYLTYLLCFIVVALTGSMSAWISLIVGNIVIGYSTWSSTQLSRMTKKMTSPLKLPIRALCIGFLVLICLVVLHTKYRIPNTFDTSSITRRLQLNQFALHMLRDHPLMGVGLNQFIVRLPEYGTVSAYTSFLQPAHNVFLLWLAETGLVGLLIPISIGVNILVKNSQRKHVHTTSDIRHMTPIIMLLIIGLLDHYPLTLQSGQLLSVLALTLYHQKTIDIN